jgi:hypothetical protein
MNRKQISNWGDLRAWGFKMLTGESDPYGMRLLVDLTPQAQEILWEFFGMPRSNKYFPDWNGGEATGSCLLPRGLLVELAKYILFHVEQAPYVVDSGTSLWAVDEETARKYYEEGIVGLQVYQNWNKDPGTNRNLHHMSGRTD